MTDSGPSCVVQVAYDPKNGSFSYSLFAPKSSAGWTVQPNGIITAPRQTNGGWHPITIAFNSADSSYTIGGLWVLDFNPPTPWLPPAGDITVYMNLPPGVSALPADGGGALLHIERPRRSPYCYRLAVRPSSTEDSDLIWDDPKIYDDGSQ